MIKSLQCFLTLSSLGQKSAFGNKAELIELIRKLPKLDFLYLLSRIDALLSANQPNSGLIQEKLVDELFEEKQRLFFKRLLATKKYDAIFHLQQIYYCMGLVLQYGVNSGPGNAEKLLPLVGNLLLWVSEFCEDDIAHPLSERQAVGILWRIGCLYSSFCMDFGAEISRSSLIYDSQEGKVFAEKFEKITGIPLATYWKVLYVIYGKWNASSTELLPNGIVIDKSMFTYFKDLQMEHVEKIFALLSEDLAKLQKRYEQKLSAFNNERNNFEFLKERPLCEFEPGKYICLSMPYLIQKASHGILDFVKEIIGAEKFSEEFSELLGNCYETYTARIIKEAYETPLAERFFRRQHKNIQICDGVIDYGDRAIFIEIKAVSILKKYKLSSDSRDIEDALKNFITIKGAAQLNEPFA